MYIYNDMVNRLDAVNIRKGTVDDREAIAEFALSLSEDPISSRDKWTKVIQEEDVYPLIAVHKHNIVGKIQARIVDKIGWLESARVSPGFRNMGIAHTLVDASLDWLISQGVDRIRTMVDSDNLGARRIMERHHFSPQFLTINPHCKISEEDIDPQNTADYAPVLDEAFYPEFLNHIQKHFGGNIMVDGRYIPLSPEKFGKLIEERRVYTNRDNSTMLILSKNNLPHEFLGWGLSKYSDGYGQIGQALKSFAARDLATIAVCHAPAMREAVIGLAHANFGWAQPHTVIVYQRKAWQERKDQP